MRALLFFSVTLLMSCLTRESKELDRSSINGSLYLFEKNNLEVQVYINGKPYLKKTPILINDLSEGDYSVDAVLPGYALKEKLGTLQIKKGEILESSFEMLVKSSGTLKIRSNPTNSLVEINGLVRGYTPLDLKGVPFGEISLRLSNGTFLTEEYFFFVQKEERHHFTLKNRVPLVFETLSNTGCIGCPELENAVYQIHGENKNPIVLSHHARFPDPNDPLYQLYVEGNDFQTQRWGYPILPSLKINGSEFTYLSLNKLETDFKDFWLNEQNKNPFSISILPNEVDGEAIIEISPVLGHSKIELEMILVNERMNYDRAPGVNGQRDCSVL